MTPAAVLLPLLLATTGDASAASKEAVAPFRELRECNGYDEEWGDCENQQPCSSCVPQNCEFGQWGDWYPGTGCSGLKYRARMVKQSNNECGTPCNGYKSEAMRYVPAHCVNQPVPCILSEWGGWSPCQNPNDQQHRERLVQQDAANSGPACNNEALSQTKPCGEKIPAVDCTFADWQVWTECSATCGQGRHTRMRKTNPQLHGGLPCEGGLLHTRSCVDQPCPNKDCVLSPWSPWSVCNEAHSQKYRTRTVDNDAKGTGMECEPNLKQTEGCVANVPHDCSLSAWTAWTSCDKDCGGGQQMRSRQIVAPAESGGTCPEAELAQVMQCNEQACVGLKKDCQLGVWAAWSTCSSECGSGTHERTRAIAAEAEAGGGGCTGSLSEVEPCEGATPCAKTDCKWSLWMEWSACSCTCGGGSKYRNRHVQTAPRLGGAICNPVLRGEVVPCAEKPCGSACVDGQWSVWSAWGSCSATCDEGYQKRSRTVAVDPNGCGKPVSGLQEEFQACGAGKKCVEDRDALLSEWAQWSYCSCTCFGVRERSRYVQQFKSGKGTSAVDKMLKEVEPCNPGAGETKSVDCGAEQPQPCLLSDWALWEDCDRTCGGGQMRRTRVIAEQPRNGGRSCEGTLVHIAPCNTQNCNEKKCMDCQWGMWSEWSTCLKCGGQRWRHREIVQAPSHCGKPCLAHFAKEVSNCTASAACGDSLFCAWTEWSAQSSCAEGCGPRTTMRNRALTVLESGLGMGVLFQSSTGGKCSGSQLTVDACPSKPCSPPCVPVDCVFGAWGHWSSHTCLGLKERRRETRLKNNECGTPCVGALVETERAAVTCDDPIPCKMSDWEMWSACATPNGQKFRSRKIESYPERDGLPCTGGLKQTASCADVGVKSDCATSEWEEWTACKKSCGGSVQARSRHITTNAAGGGAACHESLEEVRECNTQTCSGADPSCMYSQWDMWSGCGADNQRYRARKINQFGAGNGAQCTGSLQETVTCTIDKVDLQITQWTDWNVCDKPCGGGQQHRQRQISRFPKNSGIEEHQHALIETQGCNHQGCSHADCKVSKWGAWSSCSSSCGTGMSTRSRIINSNRKEGGNGCDMHLSETRACKESACDILDCAWNEWNDWGSCTCSCNGGQHSRTRSIRSPPRGGGKACPPEDSEIVRPCNTQDCHKSQCIDGAWAPWAAWSPCSVSCGGGTSFRSRHIAHSANECGSPAVGIDRDTKFCNVGVPCQASLDCQFSEWDEWSACSETCNGVKHRTRGIGRYGRGDGAWCIGHVKETVPCNGALPDNENGQLAKSGGCAVAPPINCGVGQWEEWGMCSERCGGGQHQRNRDFIRTSSNGGTACTDSLGQVQECNRQECAGQATPVDCEYGDWRQWGACTKCSGERKRYRTIIAYPKDGGKQCEPFAHEQLGECDRKCHTEHFCTWNVWTEWGQCSAKCGAGKRARRRNLVITTDKLKPPPANMAALTAQYETLYRRAESLEARHLQELVVSFGCGVVTLFVAFGAFRLTRSGGHSTQGLHPTRNLEADAVMEEDAPDA